MMYYPIMIESLSPGDLRSGVETRSIQICMKPGRKNMSHEECSEGWLGTTNDIDANALGEFSTLDDCHAFLRHVGFIPESECRDTKNRADDFWWQEPELERWYPAICRYDQIVNEFGHSALDDWLYDGRDELLERLINGESPDDLARELETEANEEGYTLVGVESYLNVLKSEAATA